ncbi:Zn(2)-C6 fungal-type domain-containing protein [Fusarium falciforme]|uniref:Zn(2)-C6 fungal-type domain-containing protein n=1 Tax=Fusarium falciforme TaxID=195108 RepID=UPI002301F1BD|nr:Zn(2)-C6 fungal-type domain-containing protein [Fusarium falciforme]WAO96835.1 Zn(2)-C6 fungal-type domain-containing protein [Fusarium falciforme]
MDNSPTPSSPHSPDTNTPSQKKPTSRACDRCRRRKAKCDFSDLAQRCTNCRESGTQCRFDIPVARRGPKIRRKRPSSAGKDAPSSNPTAELTALSSANSSTPTGTTSAQWDSSRALNVDLGLSPPTISASSVLNDGVAGHGLSALQRWQDLSRALAFIANDLQNLVTRCFDLFFEYLYPLTPLVHEPSLRDSLSYFTSFSTSESHANGTGLMETWPETAFTLITAVCAEAAFLLPKDLFPEGLSVGDLFLNASRSCLSHYLEADLENPNANSITIRYFHSNCLHAAGKPKYSWHIFGEATRLAQVMQLNEETSLEGLLPIEAELRRRAFWIVYMGDKSAAILNNRPITIHKFSFESGITTAYPTGIEDEAPILSPGNSSTNSEVIRKTCIEGFNANLRLWQNASDLLLELRLLQDREQRGIPMPNQSLLTVEERNRLDTIYIRFITCLDDLPPYLQSYTFASLVEGPRETANQFLIQCANLQVSVHCLRMVITQKLEGLPYYSPGIEHADIRKTEIARDMLRVIQEAPFWSLQVNGEPYVEKIRLIGASLLEIMHRNGTSPIASRARSDFTVLLDLLTRLDSKASDALRNTSSLVN